MYSQILSEQEEYKNFTGTIASISTFGEVPDNYDYILSQFDVVAYETESGVSRDAKSLSEAKKREIFSDPNALIMVVDDKKITDIALGQYGYLTQKQFLNYAFNAIRDDNGENINYDEDLGLFGSGITNGDSDPETGFNLPDFIGPTSKKFIYYPNNEAYYNVCGLFVHRPYETGNFMLRMDASGNLVDENGEAVTEEKGNEAQKIPLTSPDLNTENGSEMGVKLILQKKSNISYSCLSPGVYYTKAHTERILNDANESDIVKFIKALPEGKQYLSMLPYFFDYTSISEDGNGGVKVTLKRGMSLIYEGGDVMSMMMSGLSDPAERAKMLRVSAGLLGGSELPSSIYIYPTDFNAKDDVCEYLDKWNSMCESGRWVVKLQDGKYTYIKDFNAEEEIEDFESVKGLYEKSEWITLEDGSQVKLLSKSMQITYSDMVGLIIDMINAMIEMITVALVAFTALSLVVSTVMIGIITYVSVVERIKEIGILRAVGARKKDIKRLFNAETFIIGLVAGLFGILVTYLVALILNAIVV